MTIQPEIIGFIAACLTTFSFAPQALLTLKTRDTENLSLAMYTLFTIGVAVWLVYGILQRDAAVTLANAVTLMLAFPIFAIKLVNTVRGRDRSL